MVISIYTTKFEEILLVKFDKRNIVQMQHKTQNTCLGSNCEIDVRLTSNNQFGDYYYY